MKEQPILSSRVRLGIILGGIAAALLAGVLGYIAFIMIAFTFDPPQSRWWDEMGLLRTALVALPLLLAAQAIAAPVSLVRGRTRPFFALMALAAADLALILLLFARS